MSTKIRSVVVCAAILASPGAWAGATGNVGMVSDYMFRGVTQTAGPAVQGGIDYGFDSGVYVGTWVSNLNFGGSGAGTEQDVYVGFAKDVGPVKLDVGALYYWYPEEDEAGLELSTLEFYLAATMGPVTLKYSLGSETNFFIGDGAAESAAYLQGIFAWPINDTLGFTAGLGLYSGDEIERYLAGIGSSDDTYMDYSIGLTKTLDGGLTASFQYIATDIDVGGVGDDPKFVIGLKKGFDL